MVKYKIEILIFEALIVSQKLLLNFSKEEA